MAKLQLNSRSPAYRSLQPFDQSSFGDSPSGTKDISSHQIAIPESEETTPNKVYIRGVDDLSTNDLKEYSRRNYPGSPVTRVEWINDTSANLIYDSPTIALEALTSFTFPPIDLPSSVSSLELGPAKPFASFPDLNLQVRIAFTTDRKRPRAYETSRFYLIHPEHDPREQRRKDKERDNSYRDHRRRRYSGEKDQMWRSKVTDDEFDASMYDDNSPQNARTHVASISVYRNRSASPNKKTDDNISRRRRTPPPPCCPRRPAAYSKSNKDKELFPQKNEYTEGRDLFSNKLLASKVKEDLFPKKISTNNHRRSDAFDAADETADLFAGRMSVPFIDSLNTGNSLANRVTKALKTTHSQLNDVSNADSKIDNIMNGTESGDSNICGTAQGFSIRGGATNSSIATIRELFPSKANAGKELFSEKFKGRGGPRTKAKDLFY